VGAPPINELMTRGLGVYIVVCWNCTGVCCSLYLCVHTYLLSHTHARLYIYLPEDSVLRQCRTTVS